MEKKTAEQIYEANRPEYHYWGTLKSMCLASMEEYASQEKQSLEEENRKLKEALSGIMNSCDNQNPTHETIWRIAHGVLNP